MERSYGKSFARLWEILESYFYFYLYFKPFVKSPSLLSRRYKFVTRRWKDLSLFHYRVQHLPSWSPLAIFVIIFTPSTIFNKYVEIFLFYFVSFDDYKTIKAVEISCIKAFAYSEYIKIMLYRWKKKKFVPKREREAELSNFWICIAPKKRNIKWVKVQKKGSKCNYVAMVTDNLNWRLNAIKLSTLFLHLTFAVRIKLHLAARAAIVYDFSSLPKLL